MKKKFKNIGILACLAILFLFVSDAFTAWRYNPFTKKLDYYSIDIGAGLTGEAAGDVLYHDGTNWTNLTAGANGLVLTLNAGLPTWIAAGGGAPVAASYLTLGLNGVLTTERVLTAGAGIAFVDTGANGTLTISSIPDLFNIFYVSATGGDYATITSALAAENAGGEVFFVGPGTYANDQIDFSANGQTVIGMGEMDDVHVTQADTTVIPFAAFTDCVVMNVHVEVTAPTTAAADVITGTGGLTLYNVHVELTNTNVVVADQPACIDTTGIMQMFNGQIEYANTGNDGGGATAIKAAIRIGPGAVIWFDHVVFTVSGGNLSLALTSLYATGGLASFYRCFVDVNDDASSNTIGIAYSNMVAGTHEMYMNDVHVDNATNIAHGVFLINTDTMRSMFNHIHVTSAGGTAYGLNAQAGTTMVSQFDDIIAADGATTGAGAFTVAHSPADGEFTATGTVTIADLAGACIGNDVQAYNANLTTYAGIAPSANIQTFLGAVNYAAMRTQLGLVVGTDVQAQNAVLAELTALTDPDADEFPFWNNTTNNFEFSTVLFPTATGVNVGAAGNAGKLELEDADGDALGISVGVQAGDTDYVWPTAHGGAGQFLQTNGGAGVLSWAAAAGGGTMTTAMHGGVGVGDADIIELDFLAADFVIAEGADTHIDISLDYPNAQKATTAQAGILTELTTTAEVSAGVDTTRAVTVDALAGSTIGRKSMVWKLTANDEVIVDQDDYDSILVPADFAGWLITGVAARIVTADDGADFLDIGIYNVTQTAEVLSTLMRIEAGEFSTLTSAQPGVIDAGEDDITAADVLRIDIDYGGNNCTGLEVHITFERVT